MTKDMYGAIGRVGNKTYYQRMGKTIVRTYKKEFFKPQNLEMSTECFIFAAKLKGNEAGTEDCNS